MKEKPERPTVKLTTYVEPSLSLALASIAAEDERPLATTIRRLLRESVAARRRNTKREGGSR